MFRPRQLTNKLLLIIVDESPRAAIERYVAAFPELKAELEGEARFHELLDAGRWEEARALARLRKRRLEGVPTLKSVMEKVDRVQLAAAQEEQREQERADEERLRMLRERREALRKSRECDALLVEGLEAGAPEDELQAALAIGIPTAKALVERYREHGRLVVRAAACGLETPVRNILAATGDKERTEKWLLEAQALLQRATGCGASDEVHHHLELDRVDDARSFLHTAEQVAAQERQKAGILERLRRMKPGSSLRMDLEPLVEALDSGLPAREWRIALHPIQSQLK